MQFLGKEGVGLEGWPRLSHYEAIGEAGEGNLDWSSLRAITCHHPSTLCLLAISGSRKANNSKVTTRTELLYCPAPGRPNRSVQPFGTLFR